MSKEYVLLQCYKCGIYIFKLKKYKVVTCHICKKLYMRKYSKKWKCDNKDKILNYPSTKRGSIKRNAIYRKKHRDTILKRKRQWYAKKKNCDEFYKVQVAIRTQVYRYLKRGGIEKNKNTPDYLGCSYEFFKSYIESKFLDGMTWANYGVRGWHLDHIIPCSSFDFNNDGDIKRCFNYTNLQPLWWYDNLEKSNKISPKYKNSNIIID